MTWFRVVAQISKKICYLFVPFEKTLLFMLWKKPDKFHARHREIDCHRYPRITFTMSMSIIFFYQRLNFGGPMWKKKKKKQQKLHWRHHGDRPCNCNQLITTFPWTKEKRETCKCAWWLQIKLNIRRKPKTKRMIIIKQCTAINYNIPFARPLGDRFRMCQHEKLLNKSNDWCAETGAWKLLWFARRKKWEQNNSSFDWGFIIFFSKIKYKLDFDSRTHLQIIKLAVGQPFSPINMCEKRINFGIIMLVVLCYKCLAWSVWIGRMMLFI